MKFSGSVNIKAPREKVCEYFADPTYLGEYQEGFLRKELQSGQEGMDGAVSKMYYKMKNGEMELTETIVANRLPVSFEATYHHKHMDNTLHATFISHENTATTYKMQGEYTAFRGFIPKMMALFFPKMFSRQAQKWMDNFKNFVEKEVNG